MRQWYVACTNHQREFYACKNLRDQGFSVYLPKLYRHPTDPDYTGRPFDLRFTGYLFVQLDTALGEEGVVRNTRGIDSEMGQPALLSNAGKPVAIKDSVIEMLRALEDTELEIAKSRKRPEPRDDLRAGDEVVINNPDHKANGHRGMYLESERGIAKILCGFIIWEVADIDLKKISKRKKGL